jgi:hypothetical protein
MTEELEAFEQASVESGSLRDILEQCADAELERDFRPYKAVVSTIDGVQFIDGKRRVRTKPKCNAARSTAPWRNIIVMREHDDKLFLEMAVRAVGHKHEPVAGVLAQILVSRRDSKVPTVLRDIAAEASPSGGDRLVGLSRLRCNSPYGCP